MYVKRYIDSNMAYADSLFALIPKGDTDCKEYNRADGEIYTRPIR